MDGVAETIVDGIEIEELGSSPRGEALVPRDVRLVSGVSVEMDAVVGRGTVSLERLFTLRAGEVLELDASTDEPVVIRIAGKPVARGVLVAVGDRYGVQLTEVGA